MSKWQFSFASCGGASLCFPLTSHMSLHFWIFLWLWLRVWICTCIVCICDCVSRESAAEERHIYERVWLGMEAAIIFWQKKKKRRGGRGRRKKHKHSPIHSLSLPYSLSCTRSLQLSPSLSFCITYKGSRFLQNEATYGRYANEIIARGLEWDTIYPKSWLSIMTGD